MKPLEKIQQLDREIVDLVIRQGKLAYKRAKLAGTLADDEDFQLYQKNFTEALTTVKESNG